MVTATEQSRKVGSTDLGEGVGHHSFSAITTFVEICSLQYRFRYLDRLPQERVSTALVFGTAVNAALLSIDEDLAKAQPPRAEVAHQVLRSELEKAFGNKDIPVVSTHDENLDGLYGKGVKMIDFYIENLLPEEVPVMMSRRFTIPLLDEKGEALPRPLVGELDRVVRLKDGRYGIIDWKTAAARWSQDRVAKDDQATAYLLAGKYLFPEEPAFFRYDLLLKTVKPAIERYYVDRSLSDMKRFVKKVMVVDRAIQSGVFVPNDRSFACPTCPYRSTCAKWHS